MLAGIPLQPKCINAFFYYVIISEQIISIWAKKNLNLLSRYNTFISKGDQYRIHPEDMTGDRKGEKHQLREYSINRTWARRNNVSGLKLNILL